MNAAVVSVAPTWAQDLLYGATEKGWSQEGRRLLLGVGLSVLFGAAIGLRDGGAAILVHALGVPAGIAAVSGLAVPALAIVLALANAPIDALGLARATTRAASHAGLVLGGLAPAAALFAVSVEDAITVTVMGFGVLLLAGALAVRAFVRELGAPIAGADEHAKRLIAVALPAFALFASALALRVWWIALPILTRGL
jgi:hypothetical protein